MLQWRTDRAWEMCCNKIHSHVAMVDRRSVLQLVNMLQGRCRQIGGVAMGIRDVAMVDELLQWWTNCCNGGQVVARGG